ncbi:3'-5' exoribonuclease [Massilia sp. UBA6681]|uniref:3'-5' exoribonuclease n=1 Tax=Massilia sp. UBA6681 TaxID=1946839 RepID=UPI0025C0FA91|nr:3'-5' exoribonuclease [Massilia sp. UBA6681]
MQKPVLLAFRSYAIAELDLIKLTDNFMSNRLQVFIDTEFTNLSDPKLISIALVSESGEEAYFEVEFNYADCSEFVRESVLPLLQNDRACAVNSDELYSKLETWFRITKSTEQDIELCYDDEVDWRLFEKIFDNRVPRWIFPRNIEHEISPLLHFDYYKQMGCSEHHALNDARANAFSFRDKRNFM